MKTISSAVHCATRTKMGKRCRAWATAGGLCYFHSNPKKAAELGRIGGRRNRVPDLPVDPLPALRTANDVVDAGARLIQDVHSGKLDPKVGGGLASLLGLQLRAIDAKSNAEWAERIAELEKRLEAMDLLLTQRTEGVPDTRTAKREATGRIGS